MLFAMRGKAEKERKREKPVSKVLGSSIEKKDNRIQGPRLGCKGRGGGGRKLTDPHTKKKKKKKEKKWHKRKKKKTCWQGGGISWSVPFPFLSGPTKRGKNERGMVDKKNKIGVGGAEPCR